MAKHFNPQGTNFAKTNVNIAGVRSAANTEFLVRRTARAQRRNRRAL